MGNTIDTTTDKKLLRDLVSGNFSGVFEDSSLESLATNTSKLSYMTNLTKVILPSVKNFGGYNVVGGNLNLELVFLKSATSVPEYAYRSTPTPPKLVWVLPSLKTASTEAFRQGNLKALDIGEDFATSFHFRLIACYQGTAAPTAIILRMKQMATLTGTEAAGNTSVHLSGTVIYVHSDLVSSYEADTTWASMKTGHGFTFAAIEGSEYEHYYADGTPIPTT